MKHLNLENCVILNTETGEQMDIDIIMVQEGGKFDKVYKKELAEMIKCTGNRSEAIIAWLLENKNGKNQIYGTHRSIAEELGIGLPTVTKVLKRLKDAGFLKKVRNGVMLLDPKVMYYGNEANRLFILKVWNELK